MQVRNSASIGFRSLTAAAALAVAPLLGGCVIGSSSHTDVSGNYIGADTISQIQPGKDQAYVLALCGDPSDKTVLNNGTEIWKWRYSEHKKSSGSVIFLLSAESNTDNVKTTFVEFKDGIVVKAWRD